MGTGDRKVPVDPRWFPVLNEDWIFVIQEKQLAKNQKRQLLDEIHYVWLHEVRVSEVCNYLVQIQEEFRQLLESLYFDCNYHRVV